MSDAGAPNAPEGAVAEAEAAAAAEQAAMAEVQAAAAAAMKAAQVTATAMGALAQAVGRWQAAASSAGNKRREGERHAATLLKQVDSKIQELEKGMEETTKRVVVAHLEEMKRRGVVVQKTPTSETTTAQTTPPRQMTRSPQTTLSAQMTPTRLTLSTAQTTPTRQTPPVTSQQGRCSLQGRQAPPDGGGASSAAKRTSTLSADSLSFPTTPLKNQRTPKGNIALGTHFLAPDTQAPTSSSNAPYSWESTPSRLDQTQQSLLRAVKNARANDVESLLKLKVSPNFTDIIGDTLLHIAVNIAKMKERENASARILEALLDTGHLYVDAENANGQTALHVAASIQNGDSCVNHLLIHNVDVNRPDFKGDTPLHCAARFGHEKTARKLIRKGASLVAVNHDGKTPFDLAKDDRMRSVLRVPSMFSQSADERLDPSRYVQIVDLSNENNFKSSTTLHENLATFAVNNTRA